MRVPLEISFRDVPKDPQFEELIHQKVKKLEKFCDYLVSCHVAVERAQHNHKTGNPFRVRIDMRVPPGHELVIDRQSEGDNVQKHLPVLLRESFRAAERKLRKQVEQQHDYSKRAPDPEPAQEPPATVEQG